jgi:hypothetical protein
MKKNGFWNYTEPVKYWVVLVRLLPVKEPVLHWQNAFAGQTRQAVAIEYPGQPPFYIDNGDGQGLLKAESRGGPECGSRHIQNGAFEIVAQVDEGQWQHLEGGLFRETMEAIDKWQKETHPVEWQKMQDLKKAWDNSKFNPKNVK